MKPHDASTKSAVEFLRRFVFAASATEKLQLKANTLSGDRVVHDRRQTALTAARWSVLPRGETSDLANRIDPLHTRPERSPGSNRW
jgi:hypothetical protein